MITRFSFLSLLFLNFFLFFSSFFFSFFWQYFFFFSVDMEFFHISPSSFFFSFLLFLSLFFFQVPENTDYEIHGVYTTEEAAQEKAEEVRV